MSQSKRNKQPSGKPTTQRASVQPQKSRGAFYAIIGIVLAVGAGGIYYKVASAPKPIVLAQGPALPKVEGYLMGKPDAPVTIMEFADFECPQCANFATITEPDIRTRLIETGIANFRFYDYPVVELHPNTWFAHLAASCAADQDKFWPMHDLILAGQPDWEARRTKNPKPVFDGYAKTVGLDKSKFDACFESRTNIPAIQARQAAGVAMKVIATPSFVIGGKMYPGNMGYDRIKQIVDEELAKKAAIDSGKR